MVMMEPYAVDMVYHHKSESLLPPQSTEETFLQQYVSTTHKLSRQDFCKILLRVVNIW